MEQAYKSKLQSYALKQNLDLPVYATERQGPPHAPKFRTKVTFCDKTYQSPDFFPTLKSSEHAAAKLALASITPPQQQQRQKSPEEASGTAYKNLLQEIAQKQNSLLPVYSTVTTGPSHSPTFTSSVEFDGKVFNGEEAKTKKVAEMNAAKVAYMSIKYGNSNPNPNPDPNPNPNQTSSPPSSSSLLSEKLEEAASSYVKKLQEQSPKIVTPDVPSKWVEIYEEDDKEINNRVPENPTPLEKMNITVAASGGSENNHQANNGNETLESCVEEESERKKMKKLVIPYGSHIVVRPWKPEMVLPQDAEKLFSDDRFVAYRLVNP